MKRTLAVLLSAFMLLSLCVTAQAETKVPTRVINLVYDDSGSMISPDGGVTYVDTWCQARYAMEVFAAMLGEKDTLNIYYMSEYERGNRPKPQQTLTGSKDASVTESNVKAIHEFITRAGNTPFASVVKAHDDLIGDSQMKAADERWLVVLTDGYFDEYGQNSGVEAGNKFREWVDADDINVMFLSMGSNAPMIAEDEEAGIFFEKAESSQEILAKLTGICNRIFQSNALPIENDSITFGVPMSQLVVFAQGEDVKINGLVGADGKTIKASSNVRVQYTEDATTNKGYSKDRLVVADDLKGYVATYNTNFAPGTYKVDVSGAETVQVYYKPNVSIEVYLMNAEGKRVDTEGEDGETYLLSGSYSLGFGFVDATTNQPIKDEDTALLGEVVFDANVINTTASGEKLEFKAEKGTPVNLKEGSLTADVTASFLEYNTVRAELSYQVFSQKELVFTLEDAPDYDLNVGGMVSLTGEAADKEMRPMVLTVQLVGDSGPVPLTQEQWELMLPPQVTSQSDVGSFQVEKTDEIGKFHIYPSMKESRLKILSALLTDHGDIDMAVRGGVAYNNFWAQGELTDSFHVEPLTLMEIVLIIWPFVVALILILGYIPPFKKYMPHGLSKRPYIYGYPERPGIRDLDAHGRFKTNLITIFIPYKAVTGAVTFSPAPHRKVARLRAAGGGGMYVTNVSAFAGKEEFTFNGMAMEEGRTRPYRIGSGATISYKPKENPEYTYTCYLNRSK